MMSSIVKKILKTITRIQVLVVFLAFALMVFFSYWFMSEIERENLISAVDSAIANTQSYIEADLLEPKTALGVIADNIRSMIISNHSEQDVVDYIIGIGKYLESEDVQMSYTTGVYGYFDVFNGLFFHNEGLIPPSDFVPQERPWYTAAVEANGKISISDPYIDLVTDAAILSFSRRIFDNDGNPLGVISLDVLMNRIGEFAVNTSVTEGSYGILIDKNYNVLAHPHPAFIGRHVSLMNDGNALIDEINKYNTVSERKAIDYEGNESVLFVRQINNGWYLAVLAYSDEYYKSVSQIANILIFIAFILALGLSSILLSIVSAKKKAEERIQVMLDATPFCADFWDKNFNVIDCNQESLKLFGCSTKKEYIDRFSEFSPEYQLDGRLSREKGKEILAKAFEEGYAKNEWIHRKSSGELIPCEVTFVRVSHRDDYIVCAYTQDLREQKAMIAKMREADECTQILFDTSPLGCIMVDNMFNVIECNQEVLRLFNIPNKQLLKDRVYDLWPEYQPSGEVSRERIIKYLNEAYEEGYCRFEWMYQTLDGEQIPAEVVYVRVKYKGIYAVAVYIRDLKEIKAMIAEMRRAEIAEESSKAKSDFLAKMSHEIRTPMNAILGITEIQLQDKTLPLVTKEALERIYNSGDLLLSIINDILDLSKIEAGKLELTSAQYDIASLIHDIAKLNIIRYESKPIDFKVSICETVPKLLIGDELRIKQILNNLLSNAFKYTQEGQIELSLNIEQFTDDSKVVLIFCVSDTGQGMTAEQVKRLGDKFARFNMEANRTTEGTGLGMNITRNLIQLMNGQIYIKSTPNEGTTITVHLTQDCDNKSPIGKNIAENLMKLNLKIPSRMRQLQISQEYMPYGRVLVVDDVETNIYVARGLLAPYGLSIDAATNGFDTIEKIKNGSVYDIIFMDHMMPKMDGIETVKIIRELGYKEPIVALTANALAGQAEVFYRNGFDDFISKPIDIRQLNSVLNKHIRDKQSPEIIEEARKQKNTLYAAGGAAGIAIDPQLAEFFVRDAEKAANILETICENNCRRADDIPVLIVNIHAMKSALANVGERDLSADAAQLEQAGRDQNIKLVANRLPDFISALRKVIIKLKPSDEEESGEIINADIDLVYLQEQLLIIQAACANMDKKAVKGAIALLKQRTWPKDIRDSLSAISEHLLHSEFEEVALLTRQMFT